MKTSAYVRVCAWLSVVLSSLLVACAPMARDSVATAPPEPAVDRSGPKYSAAIWLMPAQPQRDRLNAVIRSLGHDHEALLGHGLPFSPAHATLASGSLNGNFHVELERLKRHADSLCAGSPPLRLIPSAPGTLGHQSAWGTFMYVELALDAPAQALFTKALSFSSGGEALRSPRSLSEPARVMPHVSFMYTDPRDRAKLDWSRLTSRPDLAMALREPVSFDTLEIVVPDAPRFDWRALLEAPASWRTLHSCRLGS